MEKDRVSCLPAKEWLQNAREMIDLCVPEFYLLWDELRLEHPSVRNHAASTQV